MLLVSARSVGTQRRDLYAEYSQRTLPGGGNSPENKMCGSTEWIETASPNFPAPSLIEGTTKKVIKKLQSFYQQ